MMLAAVFRKIAGKELPVKLDPTDQHIVFDSRGVFECHLFAEQQLHEPVLDCLVAGFAGCRWLVAPRTD